MTYGVADLKSTNVTSMVQAMMFWNREVKEARDSFSNKSGNEAIELTARLVEEGIDTPDTNYGA